MFECADVVVNSEFGRVEVDDGVADELARAVVGDIAASVSFVELHAGVCELGLGGEDVGGGVGLAGDGDDGGVLDHQDPPELGIGCFTGVEDVGVAALLELVGLVVAEALERDEGEWFHGGLYPAQPLIAL